MKSNLSILAAASLLALLSACGGSDGGESQTVGTEGLSITSANQAAIARATVTGGLAVSNIQTATNSAGSGPQPAAVAARAQSLAALARRALSAGVRSRLSIQGASAHPAAALTDTEACAVSGSLTTTFDDRDADGLLSAGDVLSVQIDACRDSATSLYDGKAVITLTTVPSAEQLTASADFQDVSSTQGGFTSSIDGTLVVAETDSDTDSTTSLSVGDGALAITLASAGYDDVVTLASGTRITVDEQFAAERTALSYDGVLQAQSVPGGAVTLTTLTPIVQLDADAFPSAGVLKVQGVHGTLLLTVTSASSVQEQLDADDDGTYESTTSVAWSSLIPS